MLLLTKTVFPGNSPQSFDEAKKTNMEQTFKSMFFCVCLTKIMTSVVVLVLILLYSPMKIFILIGTLI